ncbi:MAG: FtsQ-type POTRA domain-containing protein [Anaerolineales bacterium]|nr:FtsQ-type POTRA domain-containing protein [Anaerolineales bacterium]
MSNKRELTRAEIVRQRRNERAAKEITQTAQQALKPMVKVTSRTPTIPINSVVSKRVQKTRRFNLSLGLPEVHLPKPKFSFPAFPRLQFRANWRLTSFIIALVLGVAIYLLLTLPYFYVPQATILGNNRITREEINAVTGVTGQSIFTIQTDEVQNRVLMNYPELLSAQVNVYLPNHVYVTVVERQPVLLWQQNEGYTWIDSTGVAFRPRGFAEGLILVNAIDTPPTGIPSENSPTPYMQKELVDAITLLSTVVPAGSTLTYTSADGLGWTDSRGWVVAFGESAHDMPLKIRIYQSLVDSLIASRKVPQFISVVHPDAPFYRMTESPIVENTVDEVITDESTTIDE